MKNVLVFLCTLALAGAPFAASADPGQAYDQITRFQQGTDLASVEPGDFTADWQTAAQPAPDQPKHGGMFGKMRDAMAQAQGAMSMMSTGLAQSHYIAGSKERVDEVAQQKATITDCGARTITHLDLKAKTYYVVSMDQPETPHASTGGGRGAPAAMPTDDGTKVSISVVNKALGPKQVFGNSSSGYTSDITMVTTNAKGESHTGTMDLKKYASGTNGAWLNCSLGRTEAGGGMGAMLSRYNDMMRMIGTRKDSRLTFSSSGPALPSTLGYFEAFSFGGGENSGGDRQGRGGAFVITIERNNIRSISSSDAVFSVPGGFTKVDAP